MEIDRYEDGVPSWVDQSSPDPAAAAAFYGGLFGWDAPEGPPEMGGYRVCLLRGRLVAGIGPQMSPGPTAWATYVNVADADAILARVDVHGGKTLAGPMDVMTQGRLAMISDPAGAVIGIWQPRDHHGAGIVNEPGAWCWSEFVTPEVESAIAFYTAVFGWTAETHPGESPDGPPSYVEWQVDGRSISGLLPKPPSMPAEMPPFWGVYFAVEDIDASIAKANELGATTLMPRMDSPQGPLAALSDPVGAAFNLIQLISAS